MHIGLTSGSGRFARRPVVGRARWLLPCRSLRFRASFASSKFATTGCMPRATTRRIALIAPAAIGPVFPASTLPAAVPSTATSRKTILARTRMFARGAREDDVSHFFHCDPPPQVVPLRRARGLPSLADRARRGPTIYQIRSRSRARKTPNSTWKSPACCSRASGCRNCGIDLRKPSHAVW